MASRSQIEEKRKAFIRDKEDVLVSRIRATQAALYTKLLDLLGEFDQQDGKFSFSTSNINKTKKVTAIIEAFNKEVAAPLAKWIYRRVVELFGLNESYFERVTRAATAARNSRVRKKIMASLGYDEAKKKIITGGWLDSVANSTGVKTEITGLINRAVKGKTGFDKFKKAFRERIINPAGVGIIEKRFYSATRDIFAQQDRTMQLTYADDLALKGFIWSHTVKKTTTDFCRERSNNLYTREFAEKWDNELDWQGKKSDNNVFVDGHGFNCRATQSWLSNELFDRLAKTRKVNEYNII